MTRRVLGRQRGGGGHGRTLLGLVQGRQQIVGEQDDRAHAAVRRGGIHRNAEPVAGGEHTDDGESELRRITEAGNAGCILARQQLSGPRLLLLVHTDTGIVDNDAHTLGHRPDIDLDHRFRRRIAGGVVQQFGEHERNRFNGTAHDGEITLRPDLDAREMANAALGTADHIVERGIVPPPAEPAVTQDGDGLGTPRKLRVHVVDVEQILKDLVLAIGLLELGNRQLLLARQALKRPHGGLQRGLGGLFGPVLGLFHRLRVVIFKIGVVLLELSLFLSKLRDLFSAANNRGCGDRGTSDQTPERWILEVLRHRTLFGRRSHQVSYVWPRRAESIALPEIHERPRTVACQKAIKGPANGIVLPGVAVFLGQCAEFLSCHIR